MKFAIIIMVFGAIICSFTSNKLGNENIGTSRIFSERIFNALSIVCIMGVVALMFWKDMGFGAVPWTMFWKNIDFCVVPHILLLVTICSYAKNKKKKRFCTPFWKKLRITLKAYAILGGAGIAMEIVKKATNGNYTNKHITIIFVIVIPIILALIIIINIIFNHVLTRRRVYSYYY